MNPRLDIALAHIALEREVFPFALKRVGGRYEKTPLVRWKALATADEEQIREWAERFPKAHWGWKLDDGLVVADIDDADAFANTDLDLPAAPSQETPSGGQHRLYSGVGARQTVKAVPGLDTRVGGKGWVGLYAADSFDGDPTPAPDWLLMERPVSDGKVWRPTVDDPIETREQLLDYIGWYSGLDEEVVFEQLSAMLDDGRIVSTRSADPWIPEQHFRPLAREFSQKPRPKAPDRTLIIVHARGSKADTNGRAEPTAKLVTINARDLLAHPPERPIEVVEGLLPAGLSLLASAPKVGKSWLAYQIAVAIATGGEVLGRQATRGDVLYLALEDGEFRAWSRIESILRRTHDGQMPRRAADLDIAFVAGRGEEMVEQVEAWLDAHPAASAVLVDTLQKVRPASSGRRNQYELDVEDVGRVLKIAQRHPKLAIQVVHHDTKASRAPGSDFVDAVSGTSGISGSSDTILVLRRKRHAKVGTLEITGKDVAEGLMYLTYDDGEPFWRLDPLGGMSESQQAAFDFIRDNGPIGATQLGKALGVTKQAAQALGDNLERMGAVEKDAGKYRVAIAVRRPSPSHPIDEIDRTDGIDGIDVIDGDGTDVGGQSRQSRQSGTRAKSATADRVASRARRAS